jgi:hypothetical protein
MTIWEIIMKNLNYMSIAEDAMSKIKKGAFLTVKAGDALSKSGDTILVFS